MGVEEVAQALVTPDATVRTRSFRARSLGTSLPRIWKPKPLPHNDGRIPNRSLQPATRLAAEAARHIGQQQCAVTLLWVVAGH